MKLLKYEIRKGITLKLILLGIFALLEGFFVFSCVNHNPDQTVLSATLLVLVGLCGIVTLGVQSMLTLHHDMNTKQAYMLFMTPRSCYAILGAKLVESVLSIVIAAGLCVGCAALDYRLVQQSFGELQEMMDFLKQMTQMLQIKMDLMSIVTFGTNLLFSWIFMVTTTYLADVLVSSLLRGKKMGGLLAFILFVILNSLVGEAINRVQVDGTAMTQILVNSGLSVAASAVMYVATAHIMETRLSV